MGVLHVFVFRFGSGYTLQAKVNPALAGQETPDSTPKSSSGSPLPPLETNDPGVNRGTSSSGAFPQVGAAGVGGGGDQVDTGGFKYFVEQKFPGAVLMEEHQVCVCVVACMCVCACVLRCVCSEYVHSILLLLTLGEHARGLL